MTNQKKLCKRLEKEIIGYAPYSKIAKIIQKENNEQYIDIINEFNKKINNYRDTHPIWENCINNNLLSKILEIKKEGKDFEVEVKLHGSYKEIFDWDYRKYVEYYSIDGADVKIIPIN